MEAILAAMQDLVPGANMRLQERGCQALACLTADERDDRALVTYFHGRRVMSGAIGVLVVVMDTISCSPAVQECMCGILCNLSVISVHDSSSSARQHGATVPTHRGCGRGYGSAPWR